MIWNWQKPDWPLFSWDDTRVTKEVGETFLRETGVFLVAVEGLAPEDRDQLTVEAMSNEAVTTSEIEGEILDWASVQSSIRKQLGLAADKRRVGPAEQGIAEMMVDLYRGFAEPLSDEMLFAWHRMLMRGRRELRDVGCYRTDVEPMQVVSGAVHAPRVHFEAPASSAMPREMKNFIKWFKSAATKTASQYQLLQGLALPPLLRLHSSVRGWERSHRPGYRRKGVGARRGPTHAYRAGGNDSCQAQVLLRCT